jgi:hypothetical protein
MLCQRFGTVCVYLYAVNNKQANQPNMLEVVYSNIWNLLQLARYVRAHCTVVLFLEIAPTHTHTRARARACGPPSATIPALLTFLLYLSSMSVMANLHLATSYFFVDVGIGLR